MAVPERALCVNRFPGGVGRIFLHSAIRKAVFGFVKAIFPFRESITKRIGLFAVFFSRLSCRSFLLRQHPNTSLRDDPPPLPAAGRILANPTPSILLRPSRTAISSQSVERSAQAAESTGHFRLILRARASSWKEGPMQPSFRIVHSSQNIFKRVFSSPFRLRRRFGPHPPAQPSGTEATRRREGTAPSVEPESRRRTLRGFLCRTLFTCLFMLFSALFSARRSADHIRLVVFHHVP